MSDREIDLTSGYLRPYHTLDDAGVVIETRMLTDSQADSEGLLRLDGEPRAPKKVSRRAARGSGPSPSTTSPRSPTTQRPRRADTSEGDPPAE